MLTFRAIGKQAFQEYVKHHILYVKHHILKESFSAKPILRRWKLLTMKPPKQSNKRSNPKEQEAFKKHLAAFITRKGHETPIHLYNSIDSSLLPEEKHEAWLQEIRKIVCDRILSEEDRVPSFISLWRHWMRSCWVSQMLQNSSRGYVQFTFTA